MYLLSDNGRAELPVTDYKRSDMADGHFVIETATMPFSQEAMNCILSATALEVRLSPEEFKFNPDALKALQDYLKSILPVIKPVAKPSPSPVRRRRP